MAARHPHRVGWWVAGGVISATVAAVIVLAVSLIFGLG